MRYLSYLAFAILLNISSAFAYEFGRIVSIEPTISDNKVTNRVIYELANSGKNPIWERFVTHDDDGFFSLALVYRALLTSQGEIKSSFSVEEWNKLKDRPVTNWNKFKANIGASLTQLFCRSYKCINSNELKSIHQALFPEDESTPTWEIVNNTLGKILQERKKSFEFLTKNMSTGTITKYRLYENNKNNPVAVISESEENYIFPFNSGINSTYATDFRNLDILLKRYNELLQIGNLRSFEFPEVMTAKCQTYLTAYEKSVTVCKKDFHGFKPNRISFEFRINEERPEHSLPGIWIGSEDGPNKISISRPMEIQKKNGEYKAVLEIHDKHLVDLLWNTPSMSFSIVAHQKWDSNDGKNYTIYQDNFVITE